MQVDKKRGSSLIVIISIILFFISFLVCMLRLDIVDIVTPFLMIPIEIAVFLASATLSIVCLVFLIKRRNIKFLISLLVAMLCIVCFFLPLNTCYEDARFKLNSTRFDKAAQEMMQHSADINVLLPNQYRNLSRGGGEVIIEGDGNKKIVMFYSFRGILDNYSVYAYVPEGEAYETLSQSENWKKIIKLGENWYYCVSS